MYNELIFKYMLEKYGTDATIEYAVLHSEGCQMIYDLCHKEGGAYENYSDYGYDAQWWAKKAEELKTKNNEDTKGNDGSLS